MISERGGVMGKPLPYELWAQANREHPDDQLRKARYHELMVEHGHIVTAKGAPTGLPCGWDGFLSAEKADELKAGLKRLADLRRRVEAESRNIVMP